MKRKTVPIFIAILIGVLMFTGCVERLTQERIPGNYDNKKIYSNGGLAVIYGDYLYFINGYAKQDDPNDFGSVVKGSIARVELDENKKPKKDTFTIIVPKKFFSTQKDYGGLYIYNDWIYYPTTSLDRDSEGNPKTAQMVLMRTKVDGTGTQIIAEFDNHSVPYKIVDNTLAYIKDNNIYKINLNDKKFKPSLVEESVTNVKFTKPSDKASMDNFAIYTKTDPDTSEKYIIALSIQGDFKKTIFSSEMMGLDDVTFSATILDMKYVEDKLMILYNVEDNQKNKPYSGVYAYTYGKEFDFVKDNFVRFTQNVTSQKGFEYSSFYYVEDKVALVGKDENSNTKIDLYDNDGSYIQNAIVFNTSVTFYDFYFDEENEAYYAYYYEESKLKNIKLFEFDNQDFVAVKANATLYYEGGFSTEWIGAEIIEATLYFFNSDISNNIYYLDLDSVQDRKPETRKAKVLGKIIDKDRIAAF